VETQQLLTFGAFALRADQSVLELDGKAVPMTPKMFDTLLVLVKNQGRVVEKETLLREVWPDSFVEEGNIAFNIRQLRKLLGCDAQSPTFIETVPKRGYRFIAPVEVVEEKEIEAAPIPTETFTKSRSSAVILGIVIAILVIAIIPAIYLLQDNADARFPVLANAFSIEKLSTDGNIFHAVMSSDGKNMVYTHRNGSGKQSLWLRQLETSNAVQIIPPSDHFYGGIDLSPDGETLYFARGSQTGPQTDIYRMPVRGGLPEKIIESTQGWTSVSPDGTRISFVRCSYSNEDYCSLYVADALTGQNEKKLITRPSPIRIADNQISPDGKKVAFTSGQSRTASNDFGLYEVDIESGAVRSLTAEKFFNISYVAYLPDQSSILLTAMRRPDHDYPIWQVTLADGTAKKLTTDSECYSRLTLDKQANLILSTRVTPDFRLYVYDAQQPASPPVAIATATTASYAPDGRLLFSSIMSGNAEIWSANADGSDQRQLTNNVSSDATPIASPDGKFIFFASDRTGVLQLWRMNIDGTDAKQLTTEDGGYPLAVSPDGRWVFYRSGLNGTIRKADSATGQEFAVAPDLGRRMTVSPNSEFIAFTRRDAASLSLDVYSIAESHIIKTFTIDQPRSTIVQLEWTRDSRKLAYILTDDKRENGRLMHQDLDSSSPVQIADLRGDSFAEMPALAMSPDARSFAVIRGNWKHDAVLIRGLK
jgi:Tol biopolymer transport system component/DNA-binding winged helix-turn-helix (wHTH) protein